MMNLKSTYKYSITGVSKLLAGSLVLMIAVALLSIQDRLSELIYPGSSQRYITYSIPLSLPESYTASKPYDQEVSELAQKISQAYSVDQSKSQQFADWILTAKETHGVPENILASVIMTESEYKQESVSSKGAVGLGQIRMKYWRKECPNADKDGGANIQCAALILKQYYNNYCDRDWDCSLSIYNVGPANFKKKGEFRAASVRYVKKIYHRLAQIKHAEKKIIAEAKLKASEEEKLNPMRNDIDSKHLNLASGDAVTVYN